jgi:hypothetical protein
MALHSPGAYDRIEIDAWKESKHRFFEEKKQETFDY